LHCVGLRRRHALPPPKAPARPATPAPRHARCSARGWRLRKPKTSGGAHRAQTRRRSFCVPTPSSWNPEKRASAARSRGRRPLCAFSRCLAPRCTLYAVTERTEHRTTERILGGGKGASHYRRRSIAGHARRHRVKHWSMPACNRVGKTAER
jgi:hypothetical protein